MPSRVFALNATLRSKRHALTTATAIALATARAAGADGANDEVSIVVEGERAQPAAAPRAPHVSGSVVEGERLRQAGLQTGDVLRDEPGIQVVELGGLGAAATASLRGATAAQTPVYLGGVRINDDVGGTANLGDVPLFMLERVEVYRSHAPLVADQLGVGGALFLEPRRELENSARLGGLVGSYGSRSGSAYLSAGREGRGISAGVELSAADNDYPFPNGNGTLYVPSDDRVSRLSNADVTLKTLWLTAAERLGDARIRLFYNHSEREQGAPKLALTPSARARLALERDLFALSTSLPLPAWNGLIELTTSAVQATTTLDDPLHELNLSAQRVATPGERIEQSALARQARIGGLKLVEELTLSEERLRRLETNASELEKLAAHRLSARAAFGAELALRDDLSTDAALALGCYGTTVSGAASCDHVDPTGRLGVDFRTQSYEFYANAGRYTRPPTLSELYGASLLTRGNPNLVAERGTSLELGARYRHGERAHPDFFVDAASFARFSSELVTYVRTAQRYLVPFNDARSRVLGAELMLGVAPLRWLEATANLSLLDPRASSADGSLKNDILPFLSRLTLSAMLSARADFSGNWLESAKLSLRYNYQSSRYANPAGQGVIPEQALLDVELSALGFEQRLSARLRVANVLDARRYDVVGFPLPGRSLFLSIEAAL